MPQTIRKILRHVVVVVGVGAGLAALDGDAAVRICAELVCGEIQMQEIISEEKTVRCVSRGTEAAREDLVRIRSVERKFGLKHLGIRAGLLALASSGCRIMQPSQITHHEVGDLTQSVRKR